jgi:Ni/Co efflux regulator RcnB
MKKLVLAAIAATLVASPTLAATPQHHGGPKKVVVTKKKVVTRPGYHRWAKGQRFDRRYASNYREVDYRSYHGRLRAPPRGYHYVRSGNDVVLVAITSGIIGAVFANMIN